MNSLQGKRIFIIEDNLDNRRVMRLVLEACGAAVSFDVWGTQTVIHLLANWPVDLVLLDLMFPRNVDGFDVCDKIRAEPRFANLPVVAVSASDVSYALPICQAKGFAGFIPKPIDVDIFPDQILRVLQGEEIWYAEE